MHVVDSNLTARKLENDVGVEGAYAMFQHIKTPLMVSNRCIYSTVFNYDLPNGVFVNMSTSKGCNAIRESNAALQGKKDVLSESVVTYQKFEPLEDGSGVRISAVICVELNGSMP